MDIKASCRMLFRILFVAFNVLAALMGFIIIVLGIVSIASSRYLYIADYGWVGVPLFLIIMGIVLILFTVFGVIGAGFDVKWILFIYALGLIACIVLIAITCIAGFIWRGILDEKVRDALYTNVNLTDYNTLVDEIQEFEKCCGVNNYTDWFNTPWALNNSAGDAVPLSCCKVQHCSHGITNTLNVDHIYTEGCYGKIYNLLEQYYYGFIIAILLFCFVLALGEIVTWYLLFSTSPKSKNKYETV